MSVRRSQQCAWNEEEELPWPVHVCWRAHVKHSADCERNLYTASLPAFTCRMHFLKGEPLSLLALKNVAIKGLPRGHPQGKAGQWLTSNRSLQLVTFAGKLSISNQEINELALKWPNEEGLEPPLKVNINHNRDLETSKVNLDSPNQLGSRAIAAQQPPAHQLIHAQQNLQQLVKYLSRPFCFCDFQCYLCGAEKAKKKFLEEVEEKEQQMRQVAQKKEKPVLHIKSGN